MSEPTAARASLPTRGASTFLMHFLQGVPSGKCLCTALKLLSDLESGGLGLDIELMQCER